MASENNQTGGVPEIIDETVGTYETISSINHLGQRSLPSREAVAEILDGFREILFPGYFGRRSFTRESIRYHIGDRIWQVYRLLKEQIYLSIVHGHQQDDGPSETFRDKADELALTCLRRIPRLREWLEGDVQALYDGDPAAKSLAEIIFSYPGLHAVTVYRIGHELWEMNVPLLPRIMTEMAHSATGIDIHPGARIGRRFFIDHGTGIVIGETADIGDNVKLYQGVTLGALSFPKDQKGQVIRGRKRHPTIGDNVTIYSGATLLGAETVVGEGSTIGGNVWLTHSVPTNSVVLMKEPALVVADKSGGPSGQSGPDAPAGTGTT